MAFVTADTATFDSVERALTEAFSAAFGGDWKAEELQYKPLRRKRQRLDVQKFSDEEFMARYLAGETAAEMARAFGVHAQTIWKRAQLLGLSFRAPR